MLNLVDHELSYISIPLKISGILRKCFREAFYFFRIYFFIVVIFLWLQLIKNKIKRINYIKISACILYYKISLEKSYDGFVACKRYTNLVNFSKVNLIIITMGITKKADVVRILQFFSYFPVCKWICSDAGDKGCQKRDKQSFKPFIVCDFNRRY